MANQHLLHEQQPAKADLDRPLYAPIKRRSFFMYAGATAGATALVLAGCSKDDNNTTPGMLDVGTGDGGILNYAYALEQLEAAFYAQVRTSSYYMASGTPAAVKQVFDDLALHEAIHRDFLKAALTANSITPLKDLTPNFSSIDFTTLNGILSAARTFEDTGVAAYNGAGRYLTNNTFLGLAGKIVSVEARHAALIRDMITYNSFVSSDVVNTFTPASGDPGTGTPSLTPGNGNPVAGGERSRKPQDVLSAVNNYLADGSKLSANSYS
ncbi:ferritin-like domain-containing protein [Hymenobacter sp. RP-2-7]|uniref:Ferritin-like domain-containing protein n=1 Tax=Hymenobacter polaris TaxID=2682546 RepID=A0A7Y0FNW2_9BACT|nr:ferritin-like domain-containing protein [Hymenobacter polaris]NML67392.1 ferritin-like domain-containing protein [Hymenobacter polaris]